MSYKTILVEVDEAPDATARVEVAARIAHVAQAHLIGLASTGLTRFFRDAVGMDSASPSIASYIDTLHQRASRALAEFDKTATAAGLSNAERRQTDDDPYNALSQLARYCDLCVVSHYGTQPRPDGQRRQMVADLAAGSARPVLLLPEGINAVLPPRRVLLAWNGSREASRAMHFALPFLQGAAAVDVLLLGQTEGAGADVRPAREIGLALRRHGVVAEVIHKPAGDDVGRELMAAAAERGADLVVMGCYGHSRVREWLLGGATRSVLLSMQTPVLMAA